MINEEYMHKLATERLPTYLEGVTRDTLSDWAHELADQYVTYTWDAWQIAFVLAGWGFDGFDIMQDEIGDKPASIEQAAYWAMHEWLVTKAEFLAAEGIVTL